MKLESQYSDTTGQIWLIHGSPYLCVFYFAHVGGITGPKPGQSLNRDLVGFGIYQLVGVL